MGPSVEGLVRICANRCATRPLRQMPQDVRAMPWQRPIQANAYGTLGWAQTYSLRGPNPRPMAHKTIALTTELREPTACSPASVRNHASRKPDTNAEARIHTMTHTGSTCDPMAVAAAPHVDGRQFDLGQVRFVATTVRCGACRPGPLSDEAGGVQILNMYGGAPFGFPSGIIR